MTSNHSSDTSVIFKNPVSEKPSSSFSTVSSPGREFDFWSFIMPQTSAEGNIAASSSLEIRTAARLRPDSNHFGAIQPDFEKDDWAHGYVIENTGEVADWADEEWKNKLIPHGMSLDREWVSKP